MSPKHCFAFARVALCAAAITEVAVVHSHAAIVSYSKDNTTTVTAVNNYPGYVYEIMYTIGPLTVQAGDVVTAHYQQQLNYNGSVNAMAAGGVVVGSNASVLNAGSSGFIGWIARNAGSNVSAAEEGSCEVLSRTGSYQFTAASSTIYINAIAYGGSTSSAAPDYSVPGGGELVAVVERGVTRLETTAMNLPQAPYRGGALKYCVPIDGPALHVQYSYGPVNIAAGTMVDVRFDIEGTSEVPSGSNQRLGRSVIQGLSATATAGTTISRQMQTGITLGEHHSTWSHVGGNFYAGAVNGAYFNSALYAYGSWSTEPLFIEKSNTAYGHFVVEQRPATAGNFLEDTTNNITTLTTTPSVLFSVGPIDLAAGDVVEVRYQGCFSSPASRTTVLSRIIRASSATATTGTTVQSTLAHRFHPNYVYNGIVQSTAEQVSAAATGQYYNVIAYRTDGSAVTVTAAGEMEAVKR